MWHHPMLIAQKAEGVQRALRDARARSRCPTNLLWRAASPYTGHCRYFCMCLLKVPEGFRVLLLCMQAGYLYLTNPQRLHQMMIYLGLGAETPADVTLRKG